jgi:hypothetical protein
MWQGRVWHVATSLSEKHPSVFEGFAVRLGEWLQVALAVNQVEGAPGLNPPSMPCGSSCKGSSLPKLLKPWPW